MEDFIYKCFAPLCCDRPETAPIHCSCMYRTSFWICPIPTLEVLLYFLIHAYVYTHTNIQSAKISSSCLFVLRIKWLFGQSLLTCRSLEREGSSSRMTRITPGSLMSWFWVISNCPPTSYEDKILINTSNVITYGTCQSLSVFKTHKKGHSVSVQTTDKTNHMYM